VAIAELVRAPSAKIEITIASTATASASSSPAKKLIRRGRWISMVFSVPKPYSLPTEIAPKVSARAPANRGNPPMEFEIRFSGLVLATICSATLSFSAVR
jgi:hypothetical protein